MKRFFVTGEVFRTVKSHCRFRKFRKGLLNVRKNFDPSYPFFLRNSLREVAAANEHELVKKHFSKKPHEA